MSIQIFSFKYPNIFVQVIRSCGDDCLNNHDGFLCTSSVTHQKNSFSEKSKIVLTKPPLVCHRIIAGQVENVF